MAPSLETVTFELETAMAGSTPGREAADALCVTCVGLFEVDGAAVSLISEGSSSGTFGSSNDTSRRLDEYQFTFGEGPCLDAVSSRSAVLVPDLSSIREQRWPAFRGAALDDGVHGVFALPIMVTSECVGALDLFCLRPGPLTADTLAGARVAAALASAPLLALIAELTRAQQADDAPYDGDGDDAMPAELDRVEVYQAAGMLIPALGVSADEAMVRLRAYALATGQTASEVARAIIDGRLELERDDPDPDGSAR